MSERGNRYLRAADTYVGPALLRALSLVSRRLPLPQAPRAIGLLCFGALGDLLLLSSLVDGVRKAIPDARIVLIGSGTNRALAPLLDVPEFVTLAVSRPDKALSDLRALNLDLVLDSTQWARLPALLCALSGIPSVGFETPGQKRHYCYSRCVTHRNDEHEVDNFRALAKPCLDIPATRPRLVVSDESRAYITELGLCRYVVLHPWPSGIKSDLKQWPTQNWVALARYLGSRDITVAITGAPVDAPASTVLSEAIGAAARVENFAGKFSLSQTAALLEAAACVVSVNTGVMHMAATFDLPLVALHGPTNPLRWGPLSDMATDCRPSAKNCGYLNLGFEYPENPPDCMGSISPEAVITAVEAALA